MTVSTQKGCTHNCLFCDVAGLPFKGNLTQEEIEGQIKFYLHNTDYVKQKCDKAKNWILLEWVNQHTTLLMF